MGQPSRICQALHRNTVPSRYPKKGNWKTTGTSARHHHQGGGRLPVKGNPHGSVWVHRLEQQFGPLCLKAAHWKALPLNLMRQPFIKEPLRAVGAWSLLFTQRPSLVVNMALFSQTKHGPSLEVARHPVWCAQTFRLLTGQLTLAVSSSCFTLLMCVYFYQPLWENCPALWQLVTDKEFLIKIEISDHPQSSQPSKFQSSRTRRLVLEKNCGFRKRDCCFLCGYNEWKSTHS